MSFSAFLPRTSLSFGAGALREVGEKTSLHGSKALLVAGKGAMKKLGFLDSARTLLEQSGIEVTVFEGVEPNPSVPTIDEGISLGRKAGCDVVVALGGGSAMDAGKAMAVGISHFEENDSIWNFIGTEGRNPKKITEKTLPLVAVTSTSGTGSHVTPYAVITNPETKEKAGMRSEFIYPKESIYDINLVKSMPPKVTAETGFDVLAHAMEAQVSTNTTPFTSVFSLKAIKLVSKHLVRAFENGDDLPAREGMALADTFAGIAITLSGTVAAHALSHSISGNNTGIAHGQALASLSPAIMSLNIKLGSEETKKRYSEISTAFGKDSVPEYSVLAVTELTKRIGLFKSLSELGYSKSDIEKFCIDTFNASKRTLSRNPVVLDESKVTKIYSDCL